MKRYLLGIAILFIFISLAGFSNAVQTMNVEVIISKNNIVQENVHLYFFADEAYSTFSFTTINKPLDVIYEEDYSIIEDKGYYVIEFDKAISKGSNSINFTLLYKDIVEANGKGSVLRTSFYPATASDISIQLTLPEYFKLSKKEPSVIPKPSSIGTDGQRIKVTWFFPDAENADISVFYEGRTNYSIIIILALLAVAIFSAGTFIFHKRKLKEQIGEILSSEELKVIDEIRKGTFKQKDIASKLDFSKSKMSKIVRKLEEKGLLARKPHFKTNILSLSSKIK